MEGLGILCMIKTPGKGQPRPVFRGYLEPWIGTEQNTKGNCPGLRNGRGWFRLAEASGMFINKWIEGFQSQNVYGKAGPPETYSASWDQTAFQEFYRPPMAIPKGPGA